MNTEKDTQERTSATTSNGLSADSGDSNDEIIELTDVIKKGKGFESSDANFKFERTPAQTNSGSDAILGPDDDNLEKIIAGLESELELGETEPIQDKEEPVSPTPQDEPITLDSEWTAEEDKPSPEPQDEVSAISAIEAEETATSSDTTGEAEAPIIQPEEDTDTTPPAFDEAAVLSEEEITAGEEDRPSFKGGDETPAFSAEGVKEEAASSEIHVEAPMTQQAEKTDASTPQLDEASMDFEEDKAETVMTPEKAPDVTLSISDEQIERILTPMVKEVIEQTVRETVAEVAERVIREAIDSLKESIEPSRE